MDPRKANHKPSNPVTCILQPVAAGVDIVVPDRLVVPVAEAMPLLSLVSVVTILEGAHPIFECLAALKRVRTSHMGQSFLMNIPSLGDHVQECL